MRADSGPETDLFLDTDLCLYQGKEVKAADTQDTCHLSILPNATGGNANFCLKNRERDTESNFPLPESTISVQVLRRMQSLNSRRTRPHGCVNSKRLGKWPRRITFASRARSSQRGFGV